MVDDKRVVLVEAKSPSVMKAVGDSLPEHTVELDWTPGGDLVSRVLLKAALYLGLREMEWLFLTSHNSCIVCRLVSDNDNPFLAFSRIFSIEGSSQPFRAFMSTILSVLNGAPVQASEFHPAVALDTVPEEGEGGSSSSPEDIDGSGEYRGRSTANISSTRPITHSRAATSHDAVESELMFTLSSPHYPESFQVWAHLHSLPNNAFALPHCAENGNGKRRLWLTRHIGSGSTGNVWECHFDNGDDLFAIKVVKLQRRSDVECQRRFYNEFEVYLSLEIAYQSGQLRDRISPHCYGAFEGDGTGVLILGLCGDTLKDWDELNFSEQTQVYGLVRDLHRLGIIHGDLEPRNIARVPGGGFRLIDFSASVRHTCVEMSVRHMVTPFT
ncbi:kinase-like domain-containing protein [Lactarius akahatsu]|uniref:Kinase-like domain-containing protein n=1 Tax=Lactarius akahatsu TaxID=416441 RepID=A0AAD4L945_9AGAM|nr:kinase-like domain-containing protein [Lactarius akahatsu]